MTQQQVNQAIQIHEAGIKRESAAACFNRSTDALQKMNNYAKANAETNCTI